LNNKQNGVWKCVWMAIVWVIWNHRNNIIFRDEMVYAKEVFTMAQLKTCTTKNHVYNDVINTTVN